MKIPRRPEGLPKAELVGSAIRTLLWKENFKYILSDRSGNIIKTFIRMANELPEQFKSCLRETFRPRRKIVKKIPKIDSGAMIVRDFMFGAM